MLDLHAILGLKPVPLKLSLKLISRPDFGFSNVT